MKRKLFLLLLFPAVIYSQLKTISGTVKDDEGILLPGVTIKVKNSTTFGSVTDFDGNFKITIPDDSSKILVFSFVGYKNKEVDVSGKTNINITMNIDRTQLEEVVVIGYGTVLKKDLTGSVSSVKIAEEVLIQSNSVDQLLQGRVPGVQVIQNGGAVGAGISVRIRGTNSLRGNNEPLYVVDGIIISSAGEDVIPSGGVGNSGQEVQNGLNGINPRDIEDIQILKDASATAIYGSRGANGVVLITTKKGKKGKANINTFATTSVRMITKKHDVLDGIDYAKYINESRLVLGEEGTEETLPIYEIRDSQIYGITYDTERNPTVSENPAKVYNWQDELFKTGYSTKFGASISGGHEKGNYYASAGFDNQEGIVDNSSFKSGDLRINLNRDLSDKLKFKSTVSAFFNTSDFAEGGDLIGANQSFIRNVTAFRPIITGQEEIEEVSDLILESASPFSWVNDFSDISKEKRYIGSLGLTYNLPIKGLRYEIKVGGNIRTKDRRRFYGLTTFQGATANGALQISTLDAVSYQINNFLRFNRTVNKIHRFNVVLGTTYDVREVENSIYAVEDFVTTEKTILQPFLGGTITQPLRFINSDQQIFSILGRINYAYNDKYLITASFRRDGISKFSGDNRFGFFPSFALAWKIGNENFIQNLEFFDELKLRAGWGQIGNHGIGPYGTLSNYGISGSLYGTPGNGTSVPLTLNNVANTDLTWETTEQLNFGLDFATKNNRISGSIDVYDKTTKDLLQSANLSPSSGFANILVNRGSLSNRGLEIALNFVTVQNQNLEIILGGNIALNKSKIEKLASSADDYDDFYVDGEVQQRAFYFGGDISRGNIFKSPANVFVEGEETSLFYGYETDGIYQTDDTEIPSGSVPGDVKIVDQPTEDTNDDGIPDTGDGVIDLKDRTFIGNPNPDFVYGFNLYFKYKGLTANLLFNGVYGNDIANGNLLQLNNAEGIHTQNANNILPAAYHNAWRPDNPSNTHPRIGFTTNARPAISDRIIEDGSYLRLTNVTVGYDIPLRDSSIFKRLNIYISGQNLITWTNYSGYNPEISSFLYTGLINGVDWNGSPNASNILLGVNINF